MNTPVSTLIGAINQEETKTANGMPTLSGSLSNVVDLFFKIGASRGKDIIPAFSKAFNEDKNLALRVALWARDIRGGTGERKLFRDILSYVVKTDVALAERLIPLIPELGRWDDMTVLFGTPLERQALRSIAAALNSGNGLCAKWMDRKGANANKVRAYLKLTPKDYRKLLVGLTNVVETKMCAKDWDSIEFGKLPSVASARYQTAFHKNAEAAYVAYKAGLVKGTEKINAGAVYPYDVLKSLKHGDETVANAQWNALPNYMEGSTASILPLVDVSSSMNCAAGGSGSLTCMDVAVSLGLYISERSPGIFKDAFITFHENPSLELLNGSLSDRYRQLSHAKWGGSTNLEMAFELILNSAVKHKIAPKMMPTHLMILSDMQFNVACRNSTESAHQMIKSMYAAAGYQLPNVIYWNINASSGVPVTYDQRGTALVSGCSPAILKSVLSAKHVTPEDIMLEAIMIDRYKF